MYRHILQKTEGLEEKLIQKWNKIKHYADFQVKWIIGFKN